jgi:hypothetical protein
MKSRRSKSRKSKVGDESALKKGARASCPHLHRSWDILSQSIAGRASRPRGADSFRKIYRQAAKVAKERGGDGIADRRSRIVDRRERGHLARFFTVAGTSCPSPSLEHPAPSSAQTMNPPLLQIPPTSMFNVGCSMFDVPLPITSNQ